MVLLKVVFLKLTNSKTLKKILFLLGKKQILVKVLWIFQMSLKMLLQLCPRMRSQCWQQFKLRKLKLNLKLKKLILKTRKNRKTKMKIKNSKNLKLKLKKKRKNTYHLLIFIEKWLNVHISKKWKICMFQTSAVLKLTIL
jgi:hypothetical protein